MAEFDFNNPDFNPSTQIQDGFTRTGITSARRSITELFSGFDHRHSGSPYPRNSDHQGLVFFTRPRMNLSYNNLMEDRHFLPMTISSNGSNPSLYREIRCMFDPLLSRSDDGVQPALFDDRQAFMPLLSNTLIELSGFPDISLDTYTSPEGLRKETYALVDDIADINNTFDLTANFQNLSGDPITTLFQLWARYQSNVYNDIMVPYPDMIVENEVDYQTRIWRIKLDYSKRYVKKIGCAHAAFPVADPIGAAFNYSREQPYSEEIDQISVPFRCTGAEYNDPILVIEFNETVGLFNKAMSSSDRRNSEMSKIPAQWLNAFNHQGFPYINTDTMELEWWVDDDVYSEIVGS